MCVLQLLTAVGAFDWIRQASAGLRLVGYRYSPSRAQNITVCVLKMIIGLQNIETYKKSSIEISFILKIRQGPGHGKIEFCAG